MIRAARWTADPTQIIAGDFDLARVDSGSHLDAMVSRRRRDRQRTGNGSRRSIERRHESIARCVHLAATVHLEQTPHRFVVPRQYLLPRSIAEFLRHSCGPDDVGEERVRRIG